MARWGQFAIAKGDHFPLVSRELFQPDFPTTSDKIKEGVPAVYGWHTNVKTKPMIIDNYVVMLREKGYIERNNEALNEARYYEQKKNGSFGAKEGKHDDILMTRMIGCQICYELPLPKEVPDTVQHTGERLVGESSF